MLTIVALMLTSAGQDVEISPATRAVIARRADLPVAEWLARLDALAAGGDASAAELLGELYQRGTAEVSPDAARACGLFARSATTRGDGAHNLANCHFYGRGAPRDLPRARELYATAHVRGWPSAGCALGNMLIKGDGGPVDIPRGMALCRADAEAGNADAQTDYGGYLLTGKGGTRDPVAARKWLYAAAQQRQGNAAFLLGQIYWNGDGVAEDGVVAARWWRVAYDAGRADAAILMGRAAVGRLAAARDAGKPVDPVTLEEARKWFGIAAASDPTPAEREAATTTLQQLTALSPTNP